MQSKIIFGNLIYNPAYARKATTFLKPEYFSERSEQKLLETIQTYSATYNNIPTIDIIETELSNAKGLTENDFKGVLHLLEEIKQPNTTPDINWLLDQTKE